MVVLRAPSTLPPSSTTASASIQPPRLSWLQGSWNVTHSTLPMWKKARNVCITYTPVANTSPPQLDDLVTYQALTSPAVKTVQGVDKPFEVPNSASAVDASAGEVASLAYNWRGKGWLMIASSKWEILGYGDEEGTGNSWAVTYFAKTLFTPEGVDLYSRKGNLAPETVESIKAALVELGGDVAKLGNEVFEVRLDADGTN